MSLLDVTGWETQRLATSFSQDVEGQRRRALTDGTEGAYDDWSQNGECGETIDANKRVMNAIVATMQATRKGWNAGGLTDLELAFLQPAGEQPRATPSPLSFCQSL